MYVSELKRTSALLLQEMLHSLLASLVTVTEPNLQQTQTKVKKKKTMYIQQLTPVRF